MRVIYPPRPRGSIPDAALASLESGGEFVAQRKFNGTRTLAHIDASGAVTLWGRHGRKRRGYDPAEALLRQVGSLNCEPGLEYWLDGESLHPRVPHTVVLFDVLQAGKYLLGWTLPRRLELLREICRNPSVPADPPIAVKVSPLVWMAETFGAEFPRRYSEFLDLDLIEGLVLKRVASKLDSFGTREYEVDWQVRCRKPSKSYVF